MWNGNGCKLTAEAALISITVLSVVCKCNQCMVAESGAADSSFRRKENCSSSAEVSALTETVKTFIKLYILHSKVFHAWH